MIRYNYCKKLKKLWQMEKLLVLSNFSFCYKVFKSCLLQWRQKASICGKGLTRGPQWSMLLTWHSRIFIAEQMQVALAECSKSYKFGWDTIKSEDCMYRVNKKLFTDGRTHRRRTNHHDISPSGLWPVELKIAESCVKHQSINPGLPQCNIFARYCDDSVLLELSQILEQVMIRKDRSYETCFFAE